MVSFEASLFDPTTGNSGVSVDSLCQNFTIIDYSNYLTNTQPGCSISDFSQYLVIVITHQSGATYTLTSLGGGNQAILPASSGNTTYTAPVFAGDGVYTVQIFTVPTYNAGAAYVANTADVYFSGVLYQAIQNSTGQTPSSSSTYWSIVTQPQLLSAYQDSNPAAIACAITTCMNNAVPAAVCLMGTCNNDEFCNNPKFLLANKLILLYYNIQAAMNSGNIQSAEDSFDLAATLCKPCPGC
jgi:hypothetical protein